MSSEPTVPEFNFSQEQSEEFAQLVSDFLAKHFSETASDMEVETELKIAPRSEKSDVKTSVVKTVNTVLIGRCVQGTPQSPLCPVGQKWVNS